jgi:hypothetical protein
VSFLRSTWRVGVLSTVPLQLRLIESAFSWAAAGARAFKIICRPSVDVIKRAPLSRRAPAPLRARSRLRC